MKKNNEKVVKKSKPKLSAFDIVYKVLTAAMALATFPMVYFVSVIYVELTTPKLLDQLGSLIAGCQSNSVSSITYEKFSIKSLIQFIEETMAFLPTGEESINLWANEYFRPAIIAAIFLGIALVIALVIAITVFFTRNEKVIMVLSGAGFLSTVISSLIFTEAFAAPIISREVSLSQLFGVEGLLVNILLTFVGRITTLRLDAGFYAVMFLMLGILSWSFCVYIVNIEDRQKDKEIKKAKKASKNK